MKKVIYLLALLLVQLTAVGQTEQDFSALTIEQVKPIGELISLAVTRSPMLNALANDKARTEEEINITKKNWMQHLAFTAGVGYGTGITSDQLTGSNNADSRLTYTTRQNMYYNIGVNIRLPFTEVATRKSELKIKKLEVERIDYMKQEQKDLIREEVILRYKSLQFALASIELQNEVVETNDIALQVAESYFKAGKLPVEQYRMAVDASYSAKLELEKSKSEAWYAYRALKELVGQNILK